MASSKRTAASYVAESRNSKPKKNPFAGMTMAEMKKKYSAMTPAQRAANVETFRAAAKNAPKAKPVPKGGSKPKAKGKPPALDSRFMSSSSQYTGDALKKPASSGSGSGGGQGGRGRQGRPGVTGRVNERAKTKPATGQGGRSFAKRPGLTGRTSAPTATSRRRLSAAERRRARRSSR